ncbi:MAG: hypothetical protein M1838_002353 [Thelocarpon superellum]|nr:MAG: hypothetical protein M1838_002353 [Thelocarpon superellum]
MADKKIKEGDEVSWQWSGGRPGGTVAEVKDHGDISIQSKKGNTIKKNADPDNPAVHISRPGNDVVKRASELDKEADGDAPTGTDKKTKSKEANGAEANGEKAADAPGEKHGRDEAADKAEPNVKKQKTMTKEANGNKANGKGRPKKDDKSAKPARETKPAKPKKERPPGSDEVISSRTRSRATA